MPKRRLPKLNTAEKEYSFDKLLELIPSLIPKTDAIDFNYYLNKIKPYLIDENGNQNPGNIKAFIERMTVINDDLISRIIFHDMIRQQNLTLLKMMNEHHRWVFELLKHFKHPTIGITPLHNAAYFRQDEAIMILKENGYSDLATDRKGRTPNDYYQKQYGYNMLDGYSEYAAEISKPLIDSLRKSYNKMSEVENKASLKVARTQVYAGTLFPREKLPDIEAWVKPKWEEAHIDKNRFENEFDECVFAFKVDKPLDREIKLMSFMLLKETDDTYIFLINPQLDEFDIKIKNKIEDSAYLVHGLLKKIKLDNVFEKTDTGVYMVSSTLDEIKNIVGQFIPLIEKSGATMDEGALEKIQSFVSSSMDYRFT